MKKRTTRILIATLALLLPFLFLQSTGAKRGAKSKQKPLLYSSQRLVRATAQKESVHSSAQEPGSGRKKDREIRKDESSDEEINVDEMSSAGRVAHLAATGKLARAIAKARVRAEARKTGKDVKQLMAEDDLVDPGDLDDEEAPLLGRQPEM